MLGIYLDLETTGLDPARHRILEIAIKAFDLKAMHYLGSYEAVIAQPKEVWEQSDPASLEVNGLTLERCQEGQPEIDCGEEVVRFLQQIGIARGQAVFIGQNSSFDRAFFTQLVPVYRQELLQWPYHWLDLASMYWARLYHEQKALENDPPNLSKNGIAKHFNLSPESMPHRAMNGVDHLIKCYDSVLGTSLSELQEDSAT